MDPRTAAHTGVILAAGLAVSYALTVYLTEEPTGALTSPGVAEFVQTSSAENPEPRVPAPPTHVETPKPPAGELPSNPGSAPARAPEPESDPAGISIVDPLDAFREPPAVGVAQPPATPDPGRAPSPSEIRFTDFQRPDIVEMLSRGELDDLEPSRLSVLVYLGSMNDFFLEQSAIFDSGECTMLADPRLSIVAVLSLSKLLDGLPAVLTSIEAWMANLTAKVEQDPKAAARIAMFTLAEPDVLKKQGEMDAKVLALKYRCSSPWVRTFYSNAKRFAEG